MGPAGPKWEDRGPQGLLLGLSGAETTTVLSVYCGQIQQELKMLKNVTYTEWFSWTLGGTVCLQLIFPKLIAPVLIAAFRIGDYGHR